jgi:hypothetical protein
MVKETFLALAVVAVMLVSSYYWLGMRWLGEPFIALARLVRAMFGS